MKRVTISQNVAVQIIVYHVIHEFLLTFFLQKSMVYAIRTNNTEMHERADRIKPNTMSVPSS